MGQVDISIFLGLEKIRIRVSSDEARQIVNQVELQKDKWIKIESANTNLLLDVAEIKGVKVEKAREYKGRLPGFTIQDLSSVTSKDYFFWFRRMKKMDLDKVSDRRYACSKKNFDSLALTRSQQEDLIQMEKVRVKQVKG